MTQVEMMDGLIDHHPKLNLASARYRSRFCNDSAAPAVAALETITP